MKKIKISIKNKTQLIQALEKLYDIEYYKQQTLFEKITFQIKKYPDIYFHQGTLTKDALEMISHSKVTIVNSKALKELIVQKLSNIDHKKVFVVYPYTIAQTPYDKQIRKEFKQRYSIDKKTKLILFTANDLNIAGIQPFLKILSKLQERNFKAIVVSNKKQIDNVRSLISKLKIDFQVILIDDWENKDKLFIASDIFVLPTKQKLFAPNILKAMRYKNAVFAPNTNYASEVIDVFSVMQSLEDPSTPFRIDALLKNKQELKLIQKQNYNKSQKFDFDSRLKIVESIIESNIY
jgi:glycosyltransferase involved in cell wall biosynthesis